MANDSNKPTLTEVQINAVAELYASGKLDEAIAEIKSLNKDYPNVPLLFNILGACYQAKGLLTDSAQMFETATKIKPDYAEAHFNLGVVLKASGKTKEAIECYKKAIYLVPNYPAAHNNLGNMYKDLNQLDDAIKSYESAIAIKPDYAEAYFNLGNVYKKLKMLIKAEQSFRESTKESPNYFDAHFNLGNTLRDLGRRTEALESYEQAFEIEPNAEYVLGNVIHTKMHLCKWDNFEKEIISLQIAIKKNRRAIGPFALISLIDSPLIIRKASKIYADDKYPIFSASKMTYYPKHKRIRIGYFSADFHNHATMHLMAELFERHDKKKFELIAFSFGPDKPDEYRQRAILAFDDFIDVSFKTDDEIALLAQKKNIDIAIDLKGFTQDCRTEIFAKKCAPIQVNYLGYPGTMGAEFIDYIVADKILIPENKQQFYSEKIVYMPNSYQVNVSKRTISNNLFEKSELNLPDTGFVFCCFNSTYKITPETFTGWMNILSKVDGSVLWIYVKNNTAIQNLKKEAQKLGINPNRLIFASFMDNKDHLKRIQSADLFLDTLPYNAHTTTSDALRVGLPVLTRIGESFTSRVAASLLNAVNLPELITSSQEEYEALAIELATNADKLKTIKDKLALNLPTAPLYDTALFTQHIESAYKTMYERHHQGLKPEHIYVEH